MVINIIKIKVYARDRKAGSGLPMADELFEGTFADRLLSNPFFRKYPTRIVKTNGNLVIEEVPVTYERGGNAIYFARGELKLGERSVDVRAEDEMNMHDAEISDEVRDIMDSLEDGGELRCIIDGASRSLLAIYHGDKEIVFDGVYGAPVAGTHAGPGPETAGDASEDSPQETEDGNLPGDLPVEPEQDIPYEYKPIMVSAKELERASEISYSTIYSNYYILNDGDLCDILKVLETNKKLRAEGSRIKHEFTEETLRNIMNARDDFTEADFEYLMDVMRTDRTYPDTITREQLSAVFGNISDPTIKNNFSDAMNSDRNFDFRKVIGLYSDRLKSSRKCYLRMEKDALMDIGIDETEADLLVGMRKRKSKTPKPMGDLRGDRSYLPIQLMTTNEIKPLVERYGTTKAIIKDFLTEELDIMPRSHVIGNERSISTIRVQGDQIINNMRRLEKYLKRHRRR